MRKAIFRLLLSVLVACLPALSRAQSNNAALPAKEPAAPAPSPALEKSVKPGPAEYIILGHFERQDRLITIKSGPKGRVYSIASKDGKQLAANLSEEQIRAKSPDLYDFLKTSIAARDKARKGTILDATAERPAPPSGLRVAPPPPVK